MQGKNVLVIYYCITNYSPQKRMSWFKTTRMVSQFLWVRNLGMAQLSPLVQGLPQEASARAVVSFRGSAEEDLLPGLSSGVGRTQFLGGSWTESSLSAWCGASPQGTSQHGKKSQSRRETARQKSPSFILEVTNLLLCSPGEKHITSSSPHSQGGDYIWVCMSGSEDSQEPCYLKILSK